MSVVMPGSCTHASWVTAAFVPPEVRNHIITVLAWVIAVQMTAGMRTPMASMDMAGAMPSSGRQLLLSGAMWAAMMVPSARWSSPMRSGVAGTRAQDAASRWSLPRSTWLWTGPS